MLCGMLLLHAVAFGMPLHTVEGMWHAAAHRCTPLLAVRSSVRDW
jgi:hypothetical protein